MSPSTALRMAGVTKRYSSTVAVDDLDLEVRAGELLVILGPSGSGKSTILKLVAGFTAPTMGRIEIGEDDITDTPAHRRDVGMVFQDYALFPHMTVAENLAFPLEARKVAAADRAVRIAEALEKVDLAGFNDRYPRQLSGGQQQRVALARAIIYRPRLLLMDEPLGALDKRLRDSMQLEIKRLHSELATTIVYVTHDQEEALVLADRVAVLERGRIAQLGTAEQLYARPASAFVATFIGDSNLLRGTFDAASSSVVVGSRRLPGTVTLGRDLDDGAPAALVIRPEDVRLCPISTHQPSVAVAMVARVVQTIYLGHSVKYQLEGDDHRVIVARIGLTDGSFRPKAGDQVWLQWEAADAVILPDVPASA